MVSPWQEDEILGDILDGLNAAIEAEGWDHTKVDPIKFNKLLYLAVKHFDLPITYRWYRYGSDFTPHGRSVEEDLQPQALAELASPEEPRVDAEDVEDDITPPSPQQVCNFYREDVEDIERLFEDETKEYLRKFYEDYAPPDLQGLYSSCAVLQKSLDNVGYADEPGKVVTENVDTILSELSGLNREVMFCEPVADVDELFRKYADLLKDVLVSVADRESDLSPQQEETLRSLVRFFYKHAWKLVALKIASSHSSGEQAMDWKTTAGNRFLREYETYERNLRAIRSRCTRANLISDNLLRLTSPQARRVQDGKKAEREKEVLREWEGVSEPEG